MYTNKIDSETVKLISHIVRKELSQNELLPTAIFLANLVAVLVGVIKVDHAEAPEEIKQIVEILYLFSTPQSDLRRLTFQLVKGVRENLDYTKPSKLQTLTAPLSKSERLLLICFGYDLAVADGIMDTMEKGYLRRIASSIGIDFKYQQILEVEFSGQGTRDWDTLTEVCSLLDPNRFSNLGSEFVDAANTILSRLHDTPELPYDRCKKELQDLLRAQCPLIFLRSPEESRAIECSIAAHRTLTLDSDIQDSELVKWSFKGFQNASSSPSGKIFWETLNSPTDQKSFTIEDALYVLQDKLQKQAAGKPNRQHTYLLPDWSTFIEPNSHTIARQLKELAIEIEQKKSSLKMTLIVIGSDWSIPASLRNHVHILDLPLPNSEELYQKVFSAAISQHKLSHENARELSEKAKGMPFKAVEQTTRLITTRKLWSNPQEAEQLLLEIKKQEIRKTGVLEYHTPQGQGLQDVGGLEKIKNWIDNRQKWFNQDSQSKQRPRAILLEGYPGCGKSLIAKAIAQQWKVPQINFEISRLQSKWVGESESNTKEALRAIESSAPNILFMDEIEKAFSGVGGDTNGVMTRQFGTFLSWLNDHSYPIFLIATSNDRSKLPPELFRAGRFDEIFIILPPNTQERRKIIQTKVKYYELPAIDESTLDFLVEETAGFSGAELDKLVKERSYLSVSSFLSLKEPWQQILEQIKPQYRTPQMQALLQKYLKLISDGGGKPASAQEADFWDRIILKN